MSQAPTIGDEPGAVGLALLMSDTEAAIAAAAGEIAMLSQAVAGGFGQLPKLLTLSPAVPASKPIAAAEPPSVAPLPVAPAIAPLSDDPSPVPPPPAAPSSATPPVAPPKVTVRPVAAPPAAWPATLPGAPERSAPTAPVPTPATARPGPSPAAPLTSPSPALQQKAAPAGVAPTLRRQALPASVAPTRPMPPVAVAQQVAAPVDYAAFAPLLPAAAALPRRPETASDDVPTAAAPSAASGPSAVAQPALAPNATYALADAGRTAAAARPVSPSLAPPARRPEGGGSSAQSSGGPTHGDVFLDGARVGRWMADTLARAVSGPSSGSTAFDPQMSAAWPGALQGH